MATNATLIIAARKLVTLHDIATSLRELASTVVDDAMHHDLAINASHLDDILVTMCSDIRRACQEPYGDPT